MALSGEFDSMECDAKTGGWVRFQLCIAGCDALKIIRARCRANDNFGIFERCAVEC